MAESVCVGLLSGQHFNGIGVDAAVSVFADFSCRRLTPLLTYLPRWRYLSRTEHLCDDSATTKEWNMVRRMSLADFPSPSLAQKLLNFEEHL